MQPGSPVSRQGHSLPAIRVIVAIDHTLLREGVKAVLNLHGGIVVVDDTDRLGSLSELLTRAPCDVLLLGLGIDADDLPDLATLSRVVKIILLCDSEHAEEVLVAMRAGAHGALFKRASVEELVQAIGAVAAGQIWMPPEIQARMAESFHDDPEHRLTRREREVIRHVALGRRNAEVAKVLFITEQTVKTHLGHIFRKTGARDRVELVLYAARTGIIALSERRT